MRRAGETSALDEPRLRALVADLPFVRRLELRERVGSTNTWLRELAAEGAPEGTVTIAGEQTAGRGRLGRGWHSPPGLGLYISVLLRPAPPADGVARWTLGAAIAACVACRAAGAPEVEIEWPNDLVHRGRKLAGCLAELRAVDAGLELVVGTGINVGHVADDFPAELLARATSLRRGGAPAPEREPLAATYLRELAPIAELLHARQWNTVRERWLALAPRATGHPVVVRCASPEGQSYRGTTRGIDDAGALRVERAGGAEELVRLADAVSWED